jgi:hypothetical protein
VLVGRHQAEFQKLDFGMRLYSRERGQTCDWDGVAKNYKPQPFFCHASLAHAFGGRLRT